MRGETNVDTEVIATDNATSPLARKAMTFEAVPPGTEPRRMRPTVAASESPSTFATSSALVGIMAN